MKIKDIEKLCAEATPGPWQAVIEHGDIHQRISIIGIKQFTQNRFSFEDGKFIAASRELMPKLLAVAEAAEYVTRFDDLKWERKLADALEELEKY